MTFVSRALAVTCSPTHIPQPLKEQLALGGRMIIPVGPDLSLSRLLVITYDGTTHSAARAHMCACGSLLLHSCLNVRWALLIAQSQTDWGRHMGRRISVYLSVGTFARTVRGRSLRQPSKRDHANLSCREAR